MNTTHYVRISGRPRLGTSVWVLAVFIGGAQHLPAAVIADAFADYSGVQGQANWYYGFYDGDQPTPFQQGDFELFPYFTENHWHETEGPGWYWTTVRPLEQHGNGPLAGEGRRNEEQWAVRRWVSPVAGQINIQGSFIYIGGGGSDGSLDSITVDNALLLSHATTPGNPNFNFSLMASVHVGSIIDFSAAPRSSDYQDATNFILTISQVPEPTAFALAGAGLFAIVAHILRVRASEGRRLAQ